MPLISTPTFFANKPPQRIVSLVPSQTELLADLGLEQEVAGITKFCVHPNQWWRNKRRIGGTKTVDVAAVLALQPNLVIANKEENVAEQVLEIAATVPTYVSDMGNLNEALAMINTIGQLTHREQQADAIIDKIKNGFNHLTPLNPPLKAAYLIWKEPWMTVGNDTFIHHMMQLAGFENVFADRQRYPAVEWSEIAATAPDVLLLSSEPYPFKEKHIAALQPLLPQTRIVLVDGEMFSWYGSRLLHAPRYFTQLQKDITNK
ncbi:ABC transporter substrate-binding protein [Paracnuella aquatica]|uniref:ABC transporter substrate-binding protein n=1 Tax=Paracnuella aquatica TaxID=2268757 RepID=UPI000DEFB86A|nr:helical backbone metal receptor [Paracnuella aquatica]RPD51440.1 cobalamin-binding protein [Paracnuella aquatica]